MASARAMTNHQVTIYTLPTCGYCQDAKAYFKQRKIAYKEIDVDKDDAAAAAMVKKTGQYASVTFLAPA